MSAETKGKAVELTPEQLEQIYFQMISFGGAAKSDFLEAADLAKAGKLPEAEAKVAEAEQNYLQAHDAHFALIQKDAESPEGFLTRLILVHAEDQLAGAETVRLLTGQLIDLYRVLWAKGVLS